MSYSEGNTGTAHAYLAGKLTALYEKNADGFHFHRSSMFTDCLSAPAHHAYVSGLPPLSCALAVNGSNQLYPLLPFHSRAGQADQVATDCSVYLLPVQLVIRTPPSKLVLLRPSIKRCFCDFLRTGISRPTVAPLLHLSPGRRFLLLSASPVESSRFA